MACGVLSSENICKDRNTLNCKFQQPCTLVHLDTVWYRFLPSPDARYSCYGANFTHLFPNSLGHVVYTWPNCFYTYGQDGELKKMSFFISYCVLPLNPVKDHLLFLFSIFNLGWSTWLYASSLKLVLSHHSFLDSVPALWFSVFL